MSESTPTLPHLHEDWERALCVVAHPDDLEYGSAAAVHRWTGQGKTVTYLLATRGEAGIATMPPALAGPAREAEERESARRVGVDVVEFLGYADGILTYSVDLRRDIAREIRTRRPQLILTTNFDLTFMGGSLNQGDHRAIGLATLDATRDAANRWIFPELLDEGLEPWSGVQVVAVGHTPNPTHYVDVAGHVDAAVHSLEAHTAYNDALDASFPKPDVLVPTILSGGGAAAGVEHALAVTVYPM